MILLLKIWCQNRLTIIIKRTWEKTCSNKYKKKEVLINRWMSWEMSWRKISCLKVSIWRMKNKARRLRKVENLHKLKINNNKRKLKRLALKEQNHSYLNIWEILSCNQNNKVIVILIINWRENGTKHSKSGMFTRKLQNQASIRIPITYGIPMKKHI